MGCCIHKINVAFVGMSVRRLQNLLKYSRIFILELNLLHTVLLEACGDHPKDGKGDKGTASGDNGECGTVTAGNVCFDPKNVVELVSKTLGVVGRH